MPNDVWDDVSQEIPSASDPFVQQYLAGRTSLINQEKTSRSDTSFRNSLSPMARRACTIVDRIRDHEKSTVWTPELEEDIAQARHQGIFPGMMFMLAKDRMESTKLWNIVRRMPKGCLLHAHMDAMVDFDFLLDELMKMPGMHMSSEMSLKSKEARDDAALSFRYKAQERTEGSVWEEEYKTDSFILLTKVADDFPDGGRPGFLQWLKSRCTLSLVDSHEQHHGIDAIWKKFAKCFMVVATIVHYEPMYRSFLRRLLTLLKADGVNWAELRYAPTPRRGATKTDVYADSHGHSTTVVIDKRSLNKTTVTCSRSWRRRSLDSEHPQKARVFGALRLSGPACAAWTLDLSSRTWTIASQPRWSSHT